MHLDYIGCFIHALELMADYFPDRQEIRIPVFNNMKAKLLNGKRRLQTPIRLYKVILHAQIYPETSGRRCN